MQYFHAYRIDHVLGFFRMWEIAKHGSGGRYEPSGGLRENGLKNLRAIQTASNMLICGTQFSCFISTRVQILTQKEPPTKQARTSGMCRLRWGPCCWSSAFSG